jgi:hypothetical protein
LQISRMEPTGRSSPKGPGKRKPAKGKSRKA